MNWFFSDFSSTLFHVLIDWSLERMWQLLNKRKRKAPSPFHYYCQCERCVVFPLPLDSPQLKISTLSKSISVFERFPECFACLGKMTMTVIKKITFRSSSSLSAILLPTFIIVQFSFSCVIKSFRTMLPSRSRPKEPKSFESYAFLRTFGAR